MRIAIFADIHSNYLVFKKAFEQTKKMNIDKYIFLGDYITDGYDGDKILNLIRSSNHYAINGNREMSIIDYDKTKSEDWNKYIQWYSMRYAYETLSSDNLSYIKSLDIYKIIKVCNKKICMSHSTPYNVRGNVFKDSYDAFEKMIADFDCDIYLMGHEHKSFCTIYKNRYFINPGSIGMPTYELPYKYGILEINESKIKYESINVNYNFEELYTYYMKSDYYKIAPQWCELLVNSMRDGKNHPDDFINAIKLKAKKLNIDIKNHFPNDLFVNVFEEYKLNNFNKKIH